MDIRELIGRWEVAREQATDRREAALAAERVEQEAAEALARALDGREAVYQGRSYVAIPASGLNPAKVSVNQILFFEDR